MCQICPEACSLCARLVSLSASVRVPVVIYFSSHFPERDIYLELYPERSGTVVTDVTFPSLYALEQTHSCQLPYSLCFLCPLVGSIS